MTLFRHPDLKAAYQHVGAGGQALYVRRSFGSEFACEPASAWIIDRDEKRLYESARRFGIRKVRVMRQGREGQCVAIDGLALTKAIAECAQKEMAL